MRVVDSAIEGSLPVLAERSQPDVLFRLGSFRMPVIASSSLGADVLFDTLNKTLVTPPAIRYRRAHGDARRGFWGTGEAGRGGRRVLGAAHDGAGIGTARLAVFVRTGAGLRGDGAGAGGGGGSALRRVGRGREGRPFPGGFAEVEPREEPGQAQGGHRGGEGGPPRGEGRAVLPVGSCATGEAALAGRRRFAQARHDHVAAHGSVPAARSLAGIADRRDRRGAAPGSRFPDAGERPAEQGAGAVAGAEERAHDVAQEGCGASQVETAGAGVAASGEHPAAQDAGTRAQAEGHDKGAARGGRLREPGGSSAEPGESAAAPRVGAVAGPQEDSPQADRRGRVSAPGAGRLRRPEGTHRFAVVAHLPTGTCLEEVRRGEEAAGGRACRTSPALRCLQDGARSEQDHRVAAQGDRPTAQGERAAGQEDKVPARPQGETASPDCPVALVPGGVVEGGFREQEREAGDAALGAQTRPAARRAWSRAHLAACAQGEEGAEGAAAGRAHMFLLRRALCRQRRAFLVGHRDRGQGACPQDRAPALPPGLRLPILAPGGDRAPRRRGCSPERPTGSASGRASSTSALPASGPCVRSRRG